MPETGVQGVIGGGGDQGFLPFLRPLTQASNKCEYNIHVAYNLHAHIKIMLIKSRNVHVYNAYIRIM